MTSETIFIGDSLTEWGNWDKLFPENNILNCGVAGEQTSDILRRIEHLYKYHPSKIFLMMGINDLGENKPMAEIVQNYKAVVNKLVQQWPNVQLFLLSTLPIDQSRWKNRGLTAVNIELLNVFIKEITIQSNLSFIDMTPSFSDTYGSINSRLTSDGLHLNTHGYELWKQQIKPHLEKE